MLLLDAAALLLPTARYRFRLKNEFNAQKGGVPASHSESLNSVGTGRHVVLEVGDFLLLYSLLLLHLHDAAG